MKQNKCIMCGRPTNNTKTCSRDCFRKYQAVYNSIYGNLYRRFNDNNR